MHDVTDQIEVKATLAGATWSSSLDIRAGRSMPMRLMIQDLMPQVPTSAAGISYFQLTSMAATPSAAIAEGAAKTDAAFVGTNEHAKMLKASFVQKMVDEFFTDRETLNGYIEKFMLLGLAKAVEALILAEFIAATPTALSGAAGETIAKAKSEILAEGFEPDGVVISPGIFEDIGPTTTGGSLAGLSYSERSELGKPFFDRFLGMPIVVSSAIGASKALVGAFGGASILFRRKDAPVVSNTNSDVDDFINNLVAIRVEERVAVAVLALPAFRIVNVT